MTRRRVRQLLGGLTGLVLVTGGLTASLPAAAETRNFADGTTSSTTMDTHRVTVVNDQRLTVRVTVDDLQRRAGQGSATSWLDTDSSRSGPEFVIESGLWDSDWQIFRATGWQASGHGPLPCDIDQRLNFDTDTIAWTTGSGCLGRYGRVRVSTVTRGGGETDHSPGLRTFHPWVARTDTLNCVSRAEHDQLRIGMPKWRVHEITDTTGVAWDGHAGGYTRRYVLCWRSDRHLYLTFYAMETPHRLGEMGLGR
jgi:hypothetical protein